MSFSKLARPLALTLFSLGCAQQTDEPAAIQSNLTLTPFGNCSDLEKYIEDTAVRDMRLQLDQLLDNNGDIFGRVDGAPAPAADAAGGSKSGPSAYTTTNTQVAGVDEADFVKNDGTRIFTLSGQTLYAARSWPAADLATVGKLALDGYPIEMFLRDNQVVVFSYVYTNYNDGGGAVPVGDCFGCYGSATTKITVIDVSDLANLKVKREFFLPGSYSNSRRIGGSVRLVLSDGFRWPNGIRFWPENADANLWNDKARLRVVIEGLKADNERILRDQKLSDWLPASRYREDGGALTDIAYRCEDFYQNNAPVRLGLLTVATLNLDDPRQAPTRTSIVAEPGQVYASQKALYVASSHWWWWNRIGQMDYTYLHKFDLSDPSRARYAGSGGVAGHIVDQFSMDEDRGYLRVATTINTRVLDPQNPQNLWGRVVPSNRITVLGQRGGGLVETGRTADLASGERIYSARFLGDRGFVVTFRQVDPLFSFDLSNPQAPRQVGELKVPGFSTYLHPVGQNQLLAMGAYLPEPDANGQVDWSQRRIKLSMFDVSDLKNPRETAGLTIGTAYGYSEAAWEHKAFTYLPEKGLLAIPFSDYRSNVANYWDSFVSDLRVFSVDPARSTITPRGAVSMRDVYLRENDNRWTWYWSPWIRRSVIADDFVYAVSDAGVRVANVADLSKPVATTIFGRGQVK